jgi:hypothetical protein
VGRIALGISNRCLMQNRCLTQRSKDAKKTWDGRKGLQFERGVVERGAVLLGRAHERSEASMR